MAEIISMRSVDEAALVGEQLQDGILRLTLQNPPAFALYAFDHEITRVRHVVSEPIAGMVRFQWWRDALDAIAAGRPPAHPVVAALLARWPQFAPLRPRLHAAIDARELELTGEPPADLAALEGRLAAGCGEITLAAV